MYKSTYEIINPEALDDMPPGRYDCAMMYVDLTEHGELMLSIKVNPKRVEPRKER